MLFSTLAEFATWPWPVLVAIPFALLSLRRLLSVSRRWDDPGTSGRGWPRLSQVGDPSGLPILAEIVRDWPKTPVAGTHCWIPSTRDARSTAPCGTKIVGAVAQLCRVQTD